MEKEVVKQKERLRKRLIAERNSLDVSSKAVYDQKICVNALQLIKARKASIIHSYLPMKSELNVFPLIEQLLVMDVQVIISKTLPKGKLEHLVLTSLSSMKTGLYGTPYPCDAEVYAGDLDLVIVPGLAFDSLNYRIGYGGGYYDRFLAEYPNAYKLGVAYPFQVLEKVPRESFDVQLDQVLVNKHM